MDGRTKPGHENNLNLIRLFCAAAVVISHSPQLIDGNARREPVAQIFPATSLGELAVSSFFIVSGYLVTQSFFQTGSLIRFFRKRVLRIYPAFAASSLVCLFLVAPLSGAKPLVLNSATALELIKNIALLLPPVWPGSFHALHQKFLNGAAWTVQYEMRCYILVGLLGAFGLMRFRFLMLVATIVISLARMLLIHSGFGTESIGNWPFPIGFAIFIDPGAALFMLSVFCAGACFYLFRDIIRQNGFAALAAILVLPICLMQPETAVTGFSIFGGYALLWIGLTWRPVWLKRMTPRTDISYGLYLYGWPIASLIILYNQQINLYMLDAFTLAGAGLAGFLSWRFIERPALNFTGACLYRRLHETQQLPS